MAILDFLSLSPKGSIGGIEIQATLEESFTDSLQVTDHPVQVGANITDHSFIRPSEVVIRCGWSNSSMSALIGAVTSLFKQGSLPKKDFVSSIYSQLLALQESRAPFDITTSRRNYSDMLITSLSATTDQETGNVLVVTATCRQVIMVSTSATKLPPKSAQKDPANTAEIENAGTVQPATGSPSPGGSSPPTDWMIP
ncbi:MAG: phage baseplate protein [Sulfuricella sp.]